MHGRCGAVQNEIRPDMVIADLWLTSAPESWLRLGFAPDTPSHLCLIDLGLRFVDRRSPSASPVTGWTLVDPSHEPGTAPRRVTIDGLVTDLVAEPTCTQPTPSTLDVLGIDHVVVMTGDLERTCAAVTSVTGAPLKRIRDAGGGVRQGFHRLGPVILEVVERPDLGADTSASIWGLVVTVSDLDRAAAWLGPDVIGEPRQAVQAGRRIASIKADVGLGPAVALMTPAR